MPFVEISLKDQFPILQPGDQVEIIAPAKKGVPGGLEAAVELLISWGLKAVVSSEIYGDDLICANTDEIRLRLLRNALHNPDTKTIWCIRGGYGCTRLAPSLLAEPKPAQFKTLIGFSDITCLHLLLNKQWGWPGYHGPGAAQLATQTVDEESIAFIRNLLFGLCDSLNFSNLVAMNALNPTKITAPIIGGNLCLVECSLATPWQIQSDEKIILLEEVNEPAYRVDRSLEHLRQAGIFNQASAVLLGDFSSPHAAEIETIDLVLQRFAESLAIPVYRIPGVGHGSRNLTIPLGISATLSP